MQPKTNRPPSVKGKAAVIGAWQPDYSPTASIAAIAEKLALRHSGLNTWQGDCPACGYANSLSLTERDGTPLWHCHACNDGEAVSAAMRSHGGIAGLNNWKKFDIQSARRLNPDKLRWVRQLWEQSRPAAGTMVEQYLHGRWLTGSIPPTLRYLPDCPHKPTQRRYMAMVAAVTRWPDRQPVAIHRTYLKPDGSGKIEHPQNRMMLGDAKGGAVRLAPHGSQLGLAEGIETALSVQLATGMPMWACLSTSGLQNVFLPDDVQEVVICADHDEPGQRAAARAAERFIQLGRKVRIALPPQAGQDFNDIIKGAGQ